MKIRLLLVCALMVSVGSGAPKNPPASKTTAEEKPELVIPGVTITRTDEKGLLGIEIVDGNYKLSFYNADKEPVVADRRRALVRWSPPAKSRINRMVLNAGGDGKFLTSPQFVRPPYNFLLFITLVNAEDDESKESDVETYSVSFRQ